MILLYLIFKTFFLRNKEFIFYNIASFNNMNNVNHSTNSNIDIKQITVGARFSSGVTLNSCSLNLVNTAWE